MCERVRWDTGWFGMDWFPMAILGGIAGGAASVYTLEVGQAYSLALGTVEALGG